MHLLHKPARWILSATIAACIIPHADANTPDLKGLDSVPIQDGGRKKPLLVFADEAMLNLSGRTSLRDGSHRYNSTDVIAALWFAPAGWEKKDLILVSNSLLKQLAGLDASRKRFSHAELSGNAALMDKIRRSAAAREQTPGMKPGALEKAALDVGSRLAFFEQLAGGLSYTVLPSKDGVWRAPGADDPAYVKMREGYTTGKQEAFDKGVALLRAEQNADPGLRAGNARIVVETLYQRFHPFRVAWLLYLVSGLFLLALAGRARETGYVLAWVFAMAGFAVQAAGFACRVFVSGRAPVTNMYESVVWVAFGTMLFALVFEGVYRCRYFLLGALPVAVLSLILADTQPLILDRSIHPLVPVLADNFWLTTHVLTITLSYAAFALALGVGHIALVKVIAGKTPSAALYGYLYRALQVGVLLLAVGTILGGVWANYSWGRFWDWDPKETWALIALLGYLFVLHGRVAGAWGGFGLAVGSVLAFLSVVMAWYGVNFVLGVGLHSYGFGTGGFPLAAAYVLAELVFVGLAVVRRRAARKSDHAPTEPPAGALKAP